MHGQTLILLLRPLSAKFMDFVQIGIISNGYYNTAREQQKFQPRKLLFISVLHNLMMHALLHNLCSISVLHNFMDKR